MKKFFRDHAVLKIVWIVIFLLAVILYFILTGYFNSCIDRQTDIGAAQRWSPEGGYAQVSLYFRPGNTMTEDTLPETKYNINNYLRQLGVLEETEEGNFLIGYFGQTDVSVQGQFGSSNAHAYVVGGDFFKIHPVELLSGNTFTGEDVMHDFVLLDDETAWAIYGSSDVAGMMVEINGQEFIVRGVMKKNDGKFTEEAGYTGPTVYICCDGLNGGYDYTEGVEFVLPNQIPGYALDIVKKCFPMGEDSYVAVDQAERYKMENLWSVFKAGSTRSMVLTIVRYPWWENVARAYDDILARVFVWRVACVIIAVIPVVLLLGWMYRNLRPKGKDIRNFFDRIREGVRRRFHKEDLEEEIKRDLEYGSERESEEKV